MAEHGAPEYATAQGNDYVTHEATYKGFVHLAFIGAAHVISIVIGLAIGAVAHNWLVATGVFFIATVAAVQGFMSGGKTSSYVAIAISLAALALSAA